MKKLLFKKALTKTCFILALALFAYVIRANADGISGPLNVDVLTNENFTCDVTSLAANFNIDNFTWAANALGAGGSITGQSTPNATIVWGTDYAPTLDIITCTVQYDDGNNHTYYAYFYYDVLLRGILATVNLSGPSSIPQCCTNNVTYTVNNPGNGNIFTWSYPSGWMPVGSTTSISITLTPDYATAGSVKCVVGISTAPSSYTRTVTFAVLRPSPIASLITNNGVLSCAGATVRYYYQQPCGWNGNIPQWQLPSGFGLSGSGTEVLQEGINYFYADITIGNSSGNISITVNFNGGCSVTQNFPIVVATVSPLDVSFDNDCQPENDCSHGPKEVCALDGTTIAVIPNNPQDAIDYICSVSSPWQLLDNSTSNSGSTIIVQAAYINDVTIFLPNYRTTNLNVTSGTYTVQAENCIGKSQGVSYNFRRSNDWWCLCNCYDPCECEPLYVDSLHPCGKLDCFGGQKLAATQTESRTTKLNIYPNPSNGNYTMEMPDGIKQIIITDIAGRMIFTKPTNEKVMNINMTDNAAGIYFITVTSDTEVLKSRIAVQK